MPDTRTFHSSPGTIALCVSFDDPTYAVARPWARWNNHDLACRRVAVVSYETRTCTPASSYKPGGNSRDAISTMLPRGACDRARSRRCVDGVGAMATGLDAAVGWADGGAGPRT
jgi:hypothetical protein